MLKIVKIHETYCLHFKQKTPLDNQLTKNKNLQKLVYF